MIDGHGHRIEITYLSGAMKQLFFLVVYRIRMRISMPFLWRNMNLEQALKKMWDYGGYKQLAEAYYLRPIFFLQDEDKNKEYFSYVGLEEERSKGKEA